MTVKKFLSLILTAIIFFVPAEVLANDAEKKAAVDDAIEKTVKKLEDKKNISLEARYFSLGADANLNTSKVNLNGGELNLKDNLHLMDDKAAEIIFRYTNRLSANAKARQ